MATRPASASISTWSVASSHARSGNMSASPPASTPASTPSAPAWATSSRFRSAQLDNEISGWSDAAFSPQGGAMLKIHGDSNSGNCLKVKWVCDALALPYAWVEIDTMKGGSRTAAFLALNPLGQGPPGDFAH